MTGLPDVGRRFKLFKPDILAVSTVFSCIVGVTQAFESYLPLTLASAGCPQSYIVLVSAVASYLPYIFNILMLAALYAVGGAPLIEEAASSTVSIVVGCMVGSWVGKVSGVYFVCKFAEGYRWVEVLSEAAPFLAHPPLASIAAGCTAVLIADFTSRWDESLPELEAIEVPKPLGVSLVAWLYILVGVGLIAVFIFESLLPFSLSWLTLGFPVFEDLRLTLMLLLISSSSIAVGGLLGLGGRTGWIACFSYSLFWALISVSLLPLSAGFPLPVALAPSVLVLVNVAVAVYLVQPHVRVYFRMVNPV